MLPFQSFVIIQDGGEIVNPFFEVFSRWIVWFSSYDPHYNILCICVGLEGCFGLLQQRREIHVVFKAVEHDEHVRRLERDHGARGVRHGGAEGAEIIREDEEILEIDRVLADARIGLPRRDA